MSNTLLIVTIITGLFILIFGYYLFRKLKNIKRNSKPKKKKEKVIKKEKKTKENKELIDFKGSYVDLSKKFLFRKELKFLAFVNRILPPQYIIFPKIGLDLILEPVGNRDLYNSVANKYIDMVIFEEATMKPVVAVDLYDGTIGNEQLDVEGTDIIKAFEIAGLPLLTFKIKTDYTEAEIKTPIFKALGLMQ